MRIYLVGFMGSGKSTLGKEASILTDVPFIDTDILVTKATGMNITEVFETYGEEYFRKLEADILRETINFPKAIIATGGGLPAFGHNMEWVCYHGVAVYFEWPLASLVAQLKKSASERPLLKGLNTENLTDRISSLFEVRKPYYEQAAISIEMKPTFEENLETLVRVCRYVW